MFKPFFYHSFRSPGKLPNRRPRGFTVFVSPDPQTPKNILVYTAFCSSKDEFNKRLGRDAAQSKQPVSISAKLLDTHLSNCHQTVWGYSGSYSHIFKRMI